MQNIIMGGAGGDKGSRHAYYEAALRSDPVRRAIAFALCSPTFATTLTVVVGVGHRNNSNNCLIVAEANVHFVFLSCLMEHV